MKDKFKLDSIKQFIDIGEEDPSQEVLRKDFNSKITINPDDEHCIISDISVQTVDSDGDLVYSKGIDITRFMKNPIVLADHSYKVDSIIGHATQMEVLDDRIRIKTQLNKEIPLADKVYKLVKAGDLKGNSIGFIIKEAFIRGTKEFDTFVKAMGSSIDDKVQRIISKFTLIENSFVAIPCCDNALTQQVSVKYIKDMTPTVKEEDKTIKDEVKVEAKVVEVPAKEVVTEVVEVKEEPKYIKVIRHGAIDIDRLVELRKLAKKGRIL
jgi:phage head maturation protease